LDTSWPDVFKVLEMAYFFEEPLEGLWATLQRLNRVQAVRERFNRCWLGLRAFQKHQGIERTGDISLKMYRDIPEAFGGAVVFERDISPVREAMADPDGSGSQRIYR
jgi:hypothetical protein